MAASPPSTPDHAGDLDDQPGSAADRPADEQRDDHDGG
jgi:hypothetical protein